MFNKQVLKGFMLSLLHSKKKVMISKVQKHSEESRFLLKSLTMKYGLLLKAKNFSRFENRTVHRTTLLI